MEEKKCAKCGEIKSLTNYYYPISHNTPDKTCSKCRREYSRRRRVKLSASDDYIIKERKRGRDKYYRLGYTYDKLRDNTSKTNKYYSKYPEKLKAKNKSVNIKTPDGFQKHHWSYLNWLEKDIIFLDVRTHNKLHRYCTYDQSVFMYRRKDNNELIDTREKCEDYINEMKDWD